MKALQLLRNKTFSVLFPPCLFTLAGIVTYIICVCLRGFSGSSLAEYLICILACWMPAIIGAVSKRPLHPFIAWSIGLIAFLGVFLEQAADIYSRWYSYDWLLQLVFAFLAAACMYCLILRWKGGAMSPAGTVVFIIIATAGMAAIFELIEYYADLYGMVSDPQRWRDVVYASIDASQRARAAGSSGAYVFAGHALRETMDDLALSVIGSSLFCMMYIVNLYVRDGWTFARFFSESFAYPASHAHRTRQMLRGLKCWETDPACIGYVPTGTRLKRFIHSRSFIIWSPSVILAVVGVICYIIRLSWAGWSWVTALQMGGGVLVCFAVPVLGLICRRHFSPSFTYCISFFLVFSLFLERAINIYGLFYRYDKVLHTCVGLICAGIVFILMLRWRGNKMSPVGVICTIMLVTIGIGAIWEIFEYGTDFTGADPQRWYDVIYNSVDASYAARIAGDPGAYTIIGNALTDTMDDLGVTVIGAGGFCIAYIINLRFNHGAFFEKIFSEARITRYDKPVIRPDYLSAQSK
ncbi:MAG: hypothetical protein LUD50_04185 [Clostridia bacterium]|nr:hypothetical protein [Clostridia bacterium]